MTIRRPGGAIARRPLHFIWLLDCSGSMKENRKIESLNDAMRQTLPVMQGAARLNTEAQVLVRVLTFSNGAQWHLATPTPIEELRWTDVRVPADDAHTDLGSALALVADELRMPPMPPHAIPPHLVLVSDGMPTDDWRTGLDALMAEHWGKHAKRFAVAIGHDASFSVLQKFIGTPEIRPFTADNAERLVEHIQAVSYSVAGREPGGASPPPVTPASAPTPTPAPSASPTDSRVW